MKKIILSAIIIASFGFYAMNKKSTVIVTPPPSLNDISLNSDPVSNNQNSDNSSDVSAVSVPKTHQQDKPQISTPANSGKKSANSTPSTPSKPKGMYADGSYVGVDADAYFGNVQVKAVIQGGKLTDVSFLDYPNDQGTSRMISSESMPYLKQEAISAQSANVDIVSGATQTSQAFIQSLSSALAKAKN